MALGDAINLLLHRVGIGVDEKGDERHGSVPHSQAVMAVSGLDPGIVPAIHVLFKSENGGGWVYFMSNRRNGVLEDQHMATSAIEFGSTLLDTISFIFVAPELVGHKRLVQLSGTMQGHGQGENADDPFVRKTALIFAIVYFIPCVWLYLKSGSTLQPFIFALPVLIMLGVMLSLACLTSMERKESFSKIYFGIGALCFFIARGIALAS